MPYLLSESDRETFDGRGSFVSEDARQGCFALFNKNDMTTLQVQILARAEMHHGWVVECDMVPPYFTHVLKPITTAAAR